MARNAHSGAGTHTEPEVPVPEPLPDALTQLRTERNVRIQAMDWVAVKYFTQGIPYPAEWAVYVQALRDMPATCEPTVDDEGRLDPASVSWPSMP